MVPFDMGNDTSAICRRRLVNMANADLNMTQLKGCIYYDTTAQTEIIYPKNVGAYVAMNFT